MDRKEFKIIGLMVLIGAAMITGGIVYASYQNTATQRQVQKDTADTQKQEAKATCLAEADRLAVSVRAQNPDEDFVEYNNYRAQVNSKQITARQACLDRYGY